MIFLFLQCGSTVIIVYIIISPLNSYPYIHWILGFKLILLLLFIYFNSIIIFLYILFVYNCIFCVLLCKKYVRIKIYIYKHNIPKGKMHSNCRLLHDHIVCKITQSNNIRRANICDPALAL